jgi:hypothetical protein
MSQTDIMALEEEVEGEVVVEVLVTLTIDAIVIVSTGEVILLSATTATTLATNHIIVL